MKILLTIDSLLSSEVVIKHIENHPWSSDTMICVMNVLDLEMIESGSIDSTYATKVYVGAAEALVTSVSKRLTSIGLQTVTTVRQGHAQTEIIDYAKEWEADFIIMGSHGHSKVERFLLGSTSKTVVRNAPCSVEIVRPYENTTMENITQNDMRILVATDGSDYSHIAIESIINRSWPKDKRIKIISVFHSTPPLIDPVYVPMNVIDRINQENEILAEKYVETAKNILHSLSSEIETETFYGDPKLQILDEAKRWKANLIVVGSHGRRGISRFLMGSVSENIALHAHCSVDIIREKFSKL